MLEASVLNRANPAFETARGMVCDLDRLTELVWACRDDGMAASVSSLQADRAPWGKAGRLRVHGLSIGTSEPACSRRSVADRLAVRSPEMAAWRGRVPVVVRGRESRPHGEGEQVLVGLQRRRNKPVDAVYQADQAWLLDIQCRLYRWSRAEPADAYRDMWNWVTDPRNLRLAWRRVASNRGARSSGPDEVRSGTSSVARGRNASSTGSGGSSAMAATGRPRCGA